MIGIGRRGALLGAPLALAALPRRAAAQAFPSRQIRIIVGFASGGANDIMARLVAAKLADRMAGTPIVVENRPGAGTLLAAEYVARAAPDGYTLMYASSSTLITPLINRTSTLDPTRDFDAVVMAQSSPLLLVSRPDFPAKTLAELIALGRQRPGRITISHPGVGGINHLSLAVLMKQANVEFTLVPYNGNNPSLTALVRGEIDVASDSLFATRTLLESNTIRAIGITSAQRSSTQPNVPTFGETLPGYEVTFWGGFMAPRGTPAPILDRLNTEIDAVLKLPEVVERVKTFGADPVGGSRAHYTKVIAEDWVRWGAVVRETGVTGG
jgi:tripartite-type tricarboxylate transporter receptor subunit TctC